MFWLLATPAFASGYYYIDSGVRAIGRGGAYVVGADDLSAQYYNPAALGNIKRPMLNIQGWAANQVVNFDRADEPENDLTFEPVHNESPPILEPQLGYAAPLGGIHPVLKNTVLAVGLYVPTAPYLTYPEDGAQRYQMQSSLIWQAYAGPSVSQKITPWLTIGAGLQYTFLRVEESLTSTLCLLPDPEDCSDPDKNTEDPASDLDLAVKNWDPFELSWNAGFIVTPVPWLQIGGSIQPPISYSAPGSLTASFDEDFSLASQIDGLEFSDPDTTLKVTVPLVLRAGVQITPIESVRIEVDGVFHQWSTMDEFLITDMNMEVNGAEGGFIEGQKILVEDDIHFLTGFQDAISVRLGGDWQINEWAQVRLGGHYETGALPDATLGVNLPDSSKIGIGAGGTFTIAKRVALDIAFAQQFLGTRNITDSEASQQALWTSLANPEESAVVPGKVVGNGVLSSSVTYVGIGASVYFGAADSRAN
ncbi:MAG: outer membrane protein transport protein [Pseudomonadota bacterium]|nr:outer membrane protein transport protein [Pseudomonadota bacterium]